MKKTVLAIWMVLILAVTYVFAAVQGDFVINGVDPTTGTKFYRITATVANGLDVDVTRVQGNVTVVGTATPGDTDANSTTAVDTLSKIQLWNGASWTRVRNSTIGTGALLVGGIKTPADNYANPTTTSVESWSLNGLWNPNLSTWQREYANIIDTNNSTISALNAGVTFTGTGTDITGFNMIQVQVFSNVASATNGFQIQFSTNGTNWDEITQRTYYTTGSGESYWFSPRGQYFRIVYTNGVTNQTTFRLKTILKRNQFPGGSVPVTDPVGRTNHGIIVRSIGIGKVQGSDSSSDFRDIRVTPVGHTIVEETTRLIGVLFSSSTDTYFWTTANNGAASAAGVATGFATITSGTANSGYGDIITNRRARFLFVQPNLYRAAVRLTANAVAANTRIWGAMDVTAGNPPTQNAGYYFKYNGDTSTLSVCTMNATVENCVASGSFNGDYPSYTVDTNVHAYEIVYFLMGAWFSVDGKYLHKFSPTTAMLSSEMNLKSFAISQNGAGGTTSGSLELWSSSILRYGKENSVPRYFNITGAGTFTLKKSMGNLRDVIVNTKAGGAATLIIYDNTSAAGTIIGTADLNLPIGQLTYNTEFQTGLTVVTSAACDITVVYE